MDQIFTQRQIFTKSWEYGKNLFACIVDLEKAYERVPPDGLCKVLRKYGVDDQLLRALKVNLLPTGNLYSGNWPAIKAVPCGRWTAARVRFDTSPFQRLDELVRQMQPS